MLDRTAYRYAMIGLAVALALFLIGVSVIAAVGHAVPKELWVVGTALGGGLLGVLVPSPQATPGSKPVAESTTVQNAASKAASDAAAEPPTQTPEGAEPDSGQAARVKQKAEEAVDDVRKPENLDLAIAAASPSPGAGAAAAALAAQHFGKAEALEQEAGATNQTPARQEELEAQAKVYNAAAEAAQSPQTLTAAKEAVQIAPKGKASKNDYLTKLLPPTLVFVVALILGTLMTVGVIAPEHVYEGAAISEGNELLALATAAGGAIVGVLAPSPGQKKPTTS
jgi:hypothetical protein